MPSVNAIKESLPQGIYHVYNRGVERREIFMNHHDYQRFKLQMSKFLELEPNIDLLAYCLMPNHFHMLVRQSDNAAMSSFIRRLTIGYVMYFNKKYRRVGPLFQGKYKAVRIIGNGQLMEVSRYIHLNPERAGLGWRQHQHSSLASYVDAPAADNADGIVNPQPVLDLFDVPRDYHDYLSKGKVRS